MKSNYCTYSTAGLAKEISKATEKTLQEYKDQLYDVVQWDCFQQALACCFAALESMGWRKKRLTEFKNKVDDITHLMYTGIMGREFSPRDALQHMKDAYGIDLTESQYKEEYDRDAEKGGKK